VRIFVGMQHPSTTSRNSAPRRSRPVTQSVPLPRTRTERIELRELLESNLLALQALLEEHQRLLEARLRTMDVLRTELRAELRALGSPTAPWVQALSETRALLYVALREVIVGNNEAGVSMPLAMQEPEDPPYRLR
jgi:hypothetical protein